MFAKDRTIKRQQAALYHYETQELRHLRLIHESEGMLQHALAENKIIQECNEALARENKRLSENADLDEDMMTEMYTEYTEAMRERRQLQALEDENYRLWVENALLLGALAELAPERAAAIARRR